MLQNANTSIFINKINLLIISILLLLIFSVVPLKLFGGKKAKYFMEK